MLLPASSTKLRRNFLLAAVLMGALAGNEIRAAEGAMKNLAATFTNPPVAARPGVYWYFLDGNYDRDEMTKDLESMSAVGLKHLIFLEVSLGKPRGPWSS